MRRDQFKNWLFGRSLRNADPRPPERKGPTGLSSYPLGAIAKGGADSGTAADERARKLGACASVT